MEIYNDRRILHTILSSWINFRNFWNKCPNEDWRINFLAHGKHLYRGIITEKKFDFNNGHLYPKYSFSFVITGFEENEFSSCDFISPNINKKKVIKKVV